MRFTHQPAIQDIPLQAASRDPAQPQASAENVVAFHRGEHHGDTPSCFPAPSASLHTTLLQDKLGKKEKNLYSKDICPKNNVILQ